MKKWREYIRPIEMVGIAGLFGGFVAFTVVFTIRQLYHAIIFGGLTFIAVLVLISVLLLTVDLKKGQAADPGSSAGREEEENPADPVTEQD